MEILLLLRRVTIEKKVVLQNILLKGILKVLNLLQKKTTYSKVCEQLKEQFSQQIIDQKCIYELSTLKDRFIEILVSDENHDRSDINIKTHYFKRILSQNWPELKFIQRSGLTDLVCSNHITLDDALKQTIAFKTVNEEDGELNIEPPTHILKEPNDEVSILHKAAVILRDRIVKTQKLDKEYFSSNEVTLEAQHKFLDPMLLRFIGWLSSKSKLDEGAFIDSDNLDEKIIAICSDITSLTAHVITPKHLGLTVHLYHSFGSKKLIDDLGALGHTLPYSEMRHFLTSAAIQMSSLQDKTPSGGLVPLNIKAGDNDGKLIIAAADNWDHNERTFSGKQSTHAMTSILVAPNSSHIPSSRIPRVKERTLDTSSLPGKGLSHVLPYIKPSSRPQPSLSPPVSTDELKCSEPDGAKLLRVKELMYNIGRLDSFCDDRAVQHPPWPVYQSLVQADVLTEPANIVFNPILMAPPNDYSTVYTTLKRTKEQLNVLGQDICPIVFDMGLLTKALEIVWANKDELRGVVPLEGGMHFLVTLFSGIGYLYGDAGLRALLYKSDVYAKATTDQILSGKDFDRGIRAMLLVDEVIQGRFLNNFLAWAKESNIDIPTDLPVKADDISSDNIELIESKLVPLLDQFRSEGRQCSPLFQFWDDFLTKVSMPLKMYIASSRHAMWDAHQYAKTKLLPFFLASNRTVYARYMPYVVLQTNRVPPNVLQSFAKGSFVAKLTAGTFNSVWIDYVLETTENKALKSSGGIIGLTHQDNALTRWFLARPVTAEYSLVYKENFNQHTSTPKKHHTNTSFYKEAFNTDVQKMNNLFVSGAFIDPFSLSNPSAKLVNFANGIAASYDVQQSMLNCHEAGEQILERFVAERLVVQEGCESPQKSFFDPLPRLKVKTMTQAKCTVKYKSKNIPINGEEMHMRLLAINTFKKVPLELVMSFENSPVPLSLFTDDGKMFTNKKSVLMEKLESLIEPSKILKSVDAVDSIVFDGMAIVQMIQPIVSQVKPTYHDMATLFWQYIFDKSKGIDILHVVFDRYDQTSLKAQTREKRGDQMVAQAPSHLQQNMMVTDWKKVLASSKSKSELTLLYTKHIAEYAHEILAQTQVVYVSGGFKDKAMKITSNCVSFVEDLLSNHEEADTRILLHVQFIANRGFKNVVVVSPDTDVLILLIHHFSEIGVHELFMKTGRNSLHANLTRFIPIHHIANQMLPEQKAIVLSVYCLTGCDTSSSFYGIGKKKAFKLMMANATEFKELANIGEQPFLSPEAKCACVRFVAMLYCGDKKCMSLNSLRMTRVLDNKQINPRKLPPTDDSFWLHMSRCVYQLLIWKGCLENTFHLPSPKYFGYEIDNETGQFKPKMMSQPVAPPELLSDLACSCDDLCDGDCICSTNEQPCTQACDCKGCLEETAICKNVFTMLANVTSNFGLE